MQNGSENTFVINLRKELKLSQQEMADKMGSSRGVLSEIECGKTSVLSSTAQKLVKASGCHPAELVLGMKLPRNQDGTLMEQPDFDHMIKTTIANYEQQLKDKNAIIESLTASISEKNQLIKAQELTIRNQEREINRMEKSLESYKAD